LALFVDGDDGADVALEGHLPEVRHRIALRALEFDDVTADQQTVNPSGSNVMIACGNEFFNIWSPKGNICFLGRSELFPRLPLVEGILFLHLSGVR
jgi:hypothetical protein